MSKRRLFYIFLILFSSFIFGLDKYSIEAGFDDNIKIINDKNIKNYNDIIKYLEKEHSWYNINILTKEFNVMDNNKNNLRFLVVNIISNREHYEIFSGPVHRSLLIEEIMLNLLQPASNNYPIDILIISLNGIFLHEIDNDMQYSSVITKRDTMDCVYKYLYPNK